MRNQGKAEVAVSEPCIYCHTTAIVIDNHVVRLSRICRVALQWLLEAKIDGFKLYNRSFLTRNSEEWMGFR